MRLASVVSVALAASLSLAVRPAVGQTVVPAPVPSSVPGISVSAVGEEQVTPDRARLSIGVQTQAPTAAAASARNAQTQKAIFDTLRGMGILPEQITTSGYNVYPEQVYDQPTRRTRITGYNVQNTVVVDLRRIDQVGPVLDAVLSKGANLVSSLQFYSSQNEAVRRRALANAVERARADAESMARAAGGRVGALLELSSVFEPSRPRPMMDVAMSRMAEGAATPISEGTQTVSATVTARWQFVGGQ
ncbi:MAG: SIMPL domain-containing protein [Gemmatirosa sp.]